MFHCINAMSQTNSVKLNIGHMTSYQTGCAKQLIATIFKQPENGTVEATG